MNPTNTDFKTGNDEALRSALSGHAHQRMNARSLGLTAIKAALDFGRVVYTRGAVLHAIGRKEVQNHRRTGTDLRRFEGVQVVCAPSGTVITAYRNHDFRRLRAGLGFPRYHRSFRK